MKFTLRKKIAAITVFAIVFTVGTFSFAASRTNVDHAEIVANLTGKTVEEVVKEKYNTNTSYGVLAESYGVYEEFQKECLDLNKNILNERVEKGEINQQEAEKIYENMKANQIFCNGNMTPGFCMENEIRKNNQVRKDNNENIKAKEQKYIYNLTSENKTEVNNSQENNNTDTDENYYNRHCGNGYNSQENGEKQGIGQGRGMGRGRYCH